MTDREKEEGTSHIDTETERRREGQTILTDGQTDRQTDRRREGQPILTDRQRDKLY